MPSLNLAYIAELIVLYARKIAYILLLGSFWFAISAMWTAFVTAFFYFYDKVESLLNMMSGNGAGASSIIDMVYGLLNCIGFIDAFDYTKPLILSSITFLFGRILFNVTLSSYKYFLDSVKPLVND